MSSERLSVVSSLEEIYPVSSSEAKRYGAMTAEFEKRYGSAPAFIVRSPGRVNLIGEHIDYCGYSVLPMALENDCVIMVGPKEAQDGKWAVSLSHMDPDKFPTREYTDLEQALAIDLDNHSWSSYFQCALKGIVQDEKVQSPASFNALVHGTVPLSSGLSSSAALVCASSLAIAHANKLALQMTAPQFAQKCIDAERYVGTMSGGMDQAISILGRSGTAQRIDFHPLANTPVTLPDNVSFVIANSLAVSAKALQPWKRYNCRAVEVRLAAQLLAKGIFGDLRTTPPTATLKQVQESAKLSLREMIALLKSDQCPLKQQPYSLQEVDAALGPSLDARSMFQDSVNAKASAAVLDNTREFELYNRALHVYMEASRVLEFEAHCRSLVSATPQLGRFLTKELGLLMSASHNSCNELFDCSCPELDQLVGICIKAGALGSRLTGAGWGGCTVSLVRTEEVEAFIEQVNQQYYQAQQPALKLPAKRGDYLFASLPCRGAAIFEPTQ